MIKAITERVSPRVFRLVALPAPSDREKSQMYIQRYIPHFPAAGEVVIFDRSWYNRAGVEHVMGFCTDEQYERLKAELEDGYSGAARAGKPLLLEGGLDWKAMGLTPKDMDFLEARNGAARDIALAFGVPPMLLGIPGDNTYANYQEANRAFYRLTVLPLAARTAKEFSAWLGPVFGETVRLWFDADQVEALTGERDALWARVGAAGFLTDDEKREAVGYGKRSAGE